jgi:GT2 family glycosyltransferase
MNAGVLHATGAILLFLHADTLLPEGYVTAVTEALNSPGVCAGAFGFHVEETFGGKSLLEWSTNFRSRRLQLPYGDQGLFIRRSLFEYLGGFADLPVMEDYEFIRRLRRIGRIVTLPISATTSGRRWRRLGVFRTTLVNTLMIAGYHAGVSPKRLARFYRQVI